MLDSIQGDPVAAADGGVARLCERHGVAIPEVLRGPCIIKERVTERMQECFDDQFADGRLVRRSVVRDSTRVTERIICNLGGAPSSNGGEAYGLAYGENMVPDC